jgi:hypothetical protein
MASQYDADLQAAICWHVDIALDLTKSALAHDEYATKLLDRVRVVTACAELPGDGPLRVRCTPDVFGFKA